MLQLKATFKVIHAYHNVSGAHWDDINGANIEGTAAATVFDAYVSQKVFFFKSLSNRLD